MTVNGQNTLWCRKDACIAAYCTNSNEDSPILSGQKCRPMPLVSENIRYMRIFHAGSSWRGPEMTVGLSTMAIFGDLNGYFFGNFRDKASSII